MSYFHIECSVFYCQIALFIIIESFEFEIFCTLFLHLMSHKHIYYFRMCSQICCILSVSDSEFRSLLCIDTIFSPVEEFYLSENEQVNRVAVNN